MGKNDTEVVKWGELLTRRHALSLAIDLPLFRKVLAAVVAGSGQILYFGYSA